MKRVRSDAVAPMAHLHAYTTHTWTQGSMFHSYCVPSFHAQSVLKKKVVVVVVVVVVLVVVVVVVVAVVVVVVVQENYESVLTNFLPVVGLSPSLAKNTGQRREHELSRKGIKEDLKTKLRGREVNNMKN